MAMPAIKESEITQIIDSLGKEFTFEKFVNKAFRVIYYWDNIKWDSFEIICLYKDNESFARLLIVSEDADSYYSLQGWSQTYCSDIKRNLIDVLSQSIFLISEDEESVFEKIKNMNIGARL